MSLLVPDAPTLYRQQTEPASSSSSLPSPFALLFSCVVSSIYAYIRRSSCPRNWGGKKESGMQRFVSKKIAIQKKAQRTAAKTRFGTKR